MCSKPGRRFAVDYIARTFNFIHNFNEVLEHALASILFVDCSEVPLISQCGIKP